jgi:hypothetical protein
MYAENTEPAASFYGLMISMVNADLPALVFPTAGMSVPRLSSRPDFDRSQKPW